ncbi:MAG: hypothetical protein Q9164_007651, partial [Protoblastenia rupestris]
TASTRRGEQDTATTGQPKTPARSPARRGPVQAGRASPNYTESSLNTPTLLSSNVIKLDFDKESNEHQPTTSERKVQTRILDEEASEEEDDYVLELKQKAREKARLNNLGIHPVRNEVSALRVLEAQEQRHLSPDDQPISFQRRAARSPPQKDETVVQILIDTKIPNAKPLIVNRKVSQPMQQRERARQLGELAGDDDEDPSNGRIEVVAMTKNMFEQKRDQNDTEADANSVTDPALQDGQSQARSATAEPKYTVVMNAQGLEPLQLKVRPSTPIAKMIAGFKKVRQVDPAKTCWLIHDGDRLEPESLVRVTEIENGDAVEVHL